MAKSPKQSKPKWTPATTKMALAASHERLEQVLGLQPGLSRSLTASAMARDLLEGRVILIRRGCCPCGNPKCPNGDYQIGPIIFDDLS